MFVNVPLPWYHINLTYSKGIQDESQVEKEACSSPEAQEKKDEGSQVRADTFIVVDGNASLTLPTASKRTSLHDLN